MCNIIIIYVIQLYYAIIYSVYGGMASIDVEGSLCASERELLIEACGERRPKSPYGNNPLNII